LYEENPRDHCQHPEEEPNGPPAKRALLNWYDMITKENYFSNKDKILIQQDGLAMGLPTSGIIAEFFLQNLEDTHLTHLSNKQNSKVLLICR
jgi:hypothetical protein